MSSTPFAFGFERRQALLEGRCSAAELVEEALSRIQQTDTLINSFTRVTADRARSEAAALDRELAQGRPLGPLAGLLYSVKNLFDLEGEVTVAGSKINRACTPAVADATLVQRLKQSGALCLGAVNMGEYAYDFVTENAHDGATRNPRDVTRSAGGSSGGSGASVAAGFVDMSLGSDTNGSIRVPSSFCGLFGLKPTYGRLSRGGSFPFVFSLDHVGPLARCARDLAAVYDALQGPDPRDAACSDRGPEHALPSLEEGISNCRIGVLAGHFATGGSPEVHAAVEQVAAALRASRRIVLPEASLARSAAYLITAMEAGDLHRTRLTAFPDDFDPAARDRLLAGALMPSAWYTRAQRFRSHWLRQCLQAFSDCDLLLAPATPVTATKLDQKTMTFAGAEVPVRPNLGVFTQPLSFAGLPVVVVPVPTASGLPVGVQLVGAPWSEALLLRAARELEKSGLCQAPVSPGPFTLPP